ncbi:MAG: DUF898 family protein [Burkholderiales bacterium]
MIQPEFTGSAAEYFRIWIVNLFFTLITLGIYSAWAKVRKKRYFYGSTRIDGDSFDLMYIAYAIVYAYVQARTLNLLWNGSNGQGLRFASTLEARKMMGLYLGNLAAIAATAGLLIPWAVIRTLRYRLAHFTVIAHGTNTYLANPALERVGAAGQEFGDIFNVDLGL